MVVLASAIASQIEAADDVSVAAIALRTARALTTISATSMNAWAWSRRARASVGVQSVDWELPRGLITRSGAGVDRRVSR